jgi:hypothetical protein
MSLAAAGRLAGTRQHIDRTLLHGRWRVGMWSWASESLSNNVTGLVSLIFSVIVDDLPICGFNCNTAQLLVVYCLLRDHPLFLLPPTVASCVLILLLRVP